MKIFGTGVSTSPKNPGLFFRGGDVYTTKYLGKDAFSPPWPTWYRRWYCKYPVLPFLCIRFGGGRGMYIGWKVYGFDRPEYLNYPGITKEDVYEGSLTMTFTMRFFTDG